MFHVSRLGAKREPKPSGASAGSTKLTKVKRIRAVVSVLTASLLTAAVVGSGSQAAHAAGGSIVFSGGPGTGAPPSTLGPYTMKAFPPDSQANGAGVSSVAGPNGTTVSFSPSLTHFTIGNGWATWSNGYTGDVYATLGPQTATVTLPTGTSAFYLYAEPDNFDVFSVSATAQDGTSSGPISVNGYAGAQYFGFYGTGGMSVASITITTAGNDFAIGEFGISSGAQVSAVRFAPTNQQDHPSSPGVPVIKDDGSSPVEDHSFGPSSCADGLSTPTAFDWLDCTSPPSGTPTKNWPVIYVANSQLTVDSVVFDSPTDLTGATLTATATIGGASLSLASTPLTSSQVGSAFQGTAIGMLFTGTLPGQAGVDTLDIKWSITPSGGGSAQSAGESKHQIYVTAGAFVAAGGAVQIHNVPPYISIVDIGTRAAAGLTDPAAINKAIFAKFASLNVAHPVLDPATGLTSDGPVMKYYDNGYTTIADWWNKPIGSCPAFLTFLAQNSGHCGNWAEFNAYILGYQGISAQGVNLDQSNYFPGPDPAHGAPVRQTAYMLVGPSLWSFSNPTAPGAYSYADTVTVTNGQMTISGSEVAYHPSSSPISQGVATPPMLFATGDHAITRTPFGYVDPSYGNPSNGSPYADIRADYEKTAIAGWAVFFAKVNGSWVPVPLTVDPIRACATYQCEFRAAKNS